MNLPAIVIIGDKGNELERFFREKGLCSIYVRDIDELKKRLLNEDVAILLVEENLKTSFLRDLISSCSSNTKVVVFGNGSKSNLSHTGYEYIRWPNKDKNLILRSIKMGILEYAFLKNRRFFIKRASFNRKESLKNYQKIEKFFYFLQIFRSFKDELNRCEDLKTAVIICEKYIKKIFKCDFFGLIVDSDNQRFDIYGFGNSSETEVLENFLRYLVLSFRMLSGIQTQHLAEVYINKRKKSIDVLIDPKFSLNNKTDILFGIKSYMIFPMISGTKNLGCIAVGSKEEDTFDINDLRIISFIGYELAHVFANIKLVLHIKDISIKDALTGLYNRRYFDEILQHEYLRAKRYNLPLSLIMIDIDYFKSINDSFGHLTGDRVLQELAKLIKNSVRQVDVVARFGGEEFSIILLNTSLEKASNMAERLRSIIEKHTMLIDGNKINVTISAGISSIREDTLSERELVEEADIALLEAKRNGRNKVYMCLRKGIIKEVKAEGLRERRRFKRISTHLWINYIPLLVNNGKNMIKAILKNISEEGISFESFQEIERDALLLVDLDIPSRSGRKQHIRAIAQVVWNRKEEDKNIVGARLITLEPSVREVIKRYVIENQREE